MSEVTAALVAAVGRLSPAFRTAHARLLTEPEHVAGLAARLARLHADGPPAEPPPPRFAAERTPPVGPAFDPFRGPLARLAAGAPDPDGLARAMEAVGCDGLLLLLGQRRTPATLADARGIPPTTAALLAAAADRHHPREGLTVAARALAKHAGRSADRFWGTPAGPPASQNAHAAAVLAGILAGKTWWNVFGHFQHEAVYEARLPTGHGARWAAAGPAFVGFLEPFDPVQCPSLAGRPAGPPS